MTFDIKKYIVENNAARDKRIVEVGDDDARKAQAAVAAWEQNRNQALSAMKKAGIQDFGKRMDKWIRALTTTRGPKLANVLDAFVDWIGETSSIYFDSPKAPGYREFDRVMTPISKALEVY